MGFAGSASRMIHHNNNKWPTFNYISGYLFVKKKGWLLVCSILTSQHRDTVFEKKSNTQFSFSSWAALCMSTRSIYCCVLMQLDGVPCNLKATSLVRWCYIKTGCLVGTKFRTKGPTAAELQVLPSRLEPLLKPLYEKHHSLFIVHTVKWKTTDVFYGWSSILHTYIFCFSKVCYR